MATVSANIHLSPDDDIEIERHDNHQWLRLGVRCVVFATDADLVRIRDEIDRHATARAFIAAVNSEAA